MHGAVDPLLTMKFRRGTGGHARARGGTFSCKSVPPRLFGHARTCPSVPNDSELQGPHAERASRNSTHPQRYGGRPRKIVENQRGRAYVEMTQIAMFQAAQPQPQQQQPQASAAGSTRTRSSRSSGCGLRLPTGRSAIRPQAAAWIASPTASAGEEGSVIEATLLASASRSPGRGVFRSPRKPSPVTEASRPGIKSARS